ncbi:glutaredoxin 2 isoform X2 [Brienomyrus brachyistius]|uniref:glutaredoxin 2 isoform X2 n=1 Tax=Brienomyrus brachyistius TaxID=42636 RepID=UPI0020B24C73|nr:glutaredoxin 2 isoform X2 [Brienomyrus brachyistius]
MAKLKYSVTSLLFMCVCFIEPGNTVSTPGVIILSRMGNFSSSPGSLSSAECTRLIEDVVSHNCVVIFSKTTCPYCKMAKNVFSEIGAAYKVIELDEHRDGEPLQEALAQITGARTVPRVFVNGRCIGGGSDTKTLHEQGKLASLVEQCAPCCVNSEGSGSGHGP